MIDLDRIKICFMDFDDTICIRTNWRSNLDYYDRIIAGDSSFYNRESRAVGKGIPEFVSQCGKHNVKLYVLTWGKSNLAYRAEKGWLDSTFGKGMFEDVIFTSSREYKIDVMKHYSKALLLHESEILFVDDVPEITDMAFKEGFSVASPQLIALTYG